LINKHSAKNAYLQSNTDAANALGLTMYVPLKFWFNRNPGLALPLIALQYHEVKVKVATRNLLNLLNSNNTTGTAAITSLGVATKLYVDYIYLDTDERRRFAQQSHEYLIEQLQYQSQSAASSVKLNLNHPVKELIWTVQDTNANAAVTALQTNTDADATANTSDAITKGNDWFNYDGGHTEADKTERLNGQQSREGFNSLVLQLNGHDRFSSRRASYFRTVQPYQAGHRVPEKHVYVYSFALKPEEHQPSGTCNFSRIDNAKMEFGSTGAPTGNLNVYAVNYNVLRIMSGMGGLAYSN